MDIKELMRTYVFLNDPNVKEVTTKFGMLLAGLGLATLAVWGTVTFVEDAAVTEPRAQDASDEGTVTECVDSGEAERWRQEHAQIVEERLVSVQADGDETCFTYRSSEATHG